MATGKNAAGKKPHVCFQTIQGAAADASRFKPSIETLVISQLAEDADADKMDAQYLDFHPFQRDGILLQYGNVKLPKNMKVSFSPRVRAQFLDVPESAEGWSERYDVDDSHKVLGTVKNQALAAGVRLKLTMQAKTFGWYTTRSSPSRLIVLNSATLTVDLA